MRPPWRLVAGGNPRNERYQTGGAQQASSLNQSRVPADMDAPGFRLHPLKGELTKAFGGSPEVWLGMQMQYDLAQAERKAASIRVKRVPVPA
jgi:hypothetical protein